MNVVDFNASLDKASVFLIQRLLDKIKVAIETGEPDGEMTHELVRRTQQLAVESRLLYGRIREPDDNQEAKARLWELGYRCECGPSEVRIELPQLLPKRGVDAAFITEPLNELLSLQDNRVRFGDCTVIFQHIYGGDKTITDIKDHDNAECRAVLNVVERYFLISDSGYYCANIQMTGMGRTSKTVITLLSGKPDIFAIKRAVKSHDSL